MSDSSATNPTGGSSAGANPASVDEVDENRPRTLIIRIWPNIPILYPMAIAALICGIFSLMFGIDTELERISTTPVAKTQVAANDTQVTTLATEYVVDYKQMAERTKASQVIALIFLAFFTYTMVVVCTDIVLTWALLGLAVATILGLVVFILDIYHGLLGGLFAWLGGFVPMANAHFYFAIFAIWAVLMLAAMIYARLHYVKIESNEVIVVGGMLDKRKRYSTMRMQYTKEVCDVFEYYLPFVRSGRLIMRFPNEEEPIIIDHVMNVDRVTKKLDFVAASLQVARQDDV